MSLRLNPDLDSEKAAQLLTYTVMPVISAAHHPATPDFSPLDVPSSLYTALHQSSKAGQTIPKAGLDRVDLGEGMSAIVQFEEDTTQHPVAALIYALGSLRDLGLTDQARHQGLLGAGERLTIPGQANSTSLTGEQIRPTEGVVLILCDQQDWQQEFDASLLDVDVLPALHNFGCKTVADYENCTRGSYVTTDNRGIVLDVSYFKAHDGLEVAAEETWPALLGLAAGHARRSYDISVAARLCDLLGGTTHADNISATMRLTQLRRVQMRLAARGVQSVLEHQTYQPASGDDAFRMHHQLNQINAAADREVCEAFSQFQPLIEAAEASAEESRQRRTLAVTQRAGATVAGAGLLGIFAALAAIPRTGGVLSPSLRAAFATLALAGAVAVIALLLERALRTEVQAGRRAHLAATTLGWMLLAGALCFAWLAWLGKWASSPPILLLVLTMLLAGGTLLLTVRSNEPNRRPGS